MSSPIYNYPGKCTYVTTSRTNFKHHIKHAHTHKDGERWIKVTNKNQEEQVGKHEQVEDITFPEIDHKNAAEWNTLAKPKDEVKKE